MLNHFPKKLDGFAYSEDFDILHVGFHQEDRSAVDAAHARLVADGWAVPAPRDYTAPGPSTSRRRGAYFIEVLHQYRQG